MQTRIKIVELNNGEKTFYPQYLDDLDEFSFPPKGEEDRWKYFEEYLRSWGYFIWRQAVVRRNLKDAQAYIDEQLGLEVKSTTYVKYP